ncbi:MAG: DUF2085 domain-containing protein [Anaerolineaceae bacterium]|nr:DUF2085 domain-containing protein [Anaerolineaceae bacterium]MCY4105665.1 DUF2085 domain-containing protein [Chloroflexota bacterium]
MRPRAIPFRQRLARHWLNAVTLAIALFTSGALAAPLLAHSGLHSASHTLYDLYSPFCHQFAFRSFFLFGENLFYPREISGSSAPPFEDAALASAPFRSLYRTQIAIGQNRGRPRGPLGEENSIPQDEPALTRKNLLVYSPALQFAARDFIGDANFGYKIALCERDFAIWLAMLLAALAFRRLRGRLQPPPISLYLLLGLAPIAIDGLSQLLGYPPFQFWPERETLPHFRVLTGALFGAMNVWLIFPHFEAIQRRFAYQTAPNSL